MKKVFFLFLSLILVFLLILIPVSASSPETYIFTSPHILASSSTSSPNSEGFYSIPYSWDSPSSFSFLYSDVEDYISDNSNGDYGIRFYPLFVDSYNQIIHLNSSLISANDFSLVLTNLDDDSTITLSDWLDSGIIYVSASSFNSGRSDYSVTLSFYRSDILGDSDYSFVPVKVMFVPVFDDPSFVSIIDSAFLSPYMEESAYDDGFSDGYTDGVLSDSSGSYSSGYSEGYHYGYNEGYDGGFIDGSDSGFDSGFQEGNALGFSSGYNAGYNAGQSDDVSSDIRGVVMSTVSAPFVAISNFLDFEVLGINLRQIFAFVFSCALFAWAIKHIL